MSQGKCGGRPLKFKTVEDLQEKIDAYFEYCDNKVIRRIVNKNGDLISEVSTPYTVTGLASFLGVDRQTLINYEDKSDVFFTIIKDVKAKIEAEYENRALSGESTPAMSIFTLKNNFKWKDVQDINQNIVTPKPLLDSIIDKDGSPKEIDAPKVEKKD